MRAICVTLAITSLVSCTTVHTPVGTCPRKLVREWAIAPDRLVRQATVDEAERRHVVNGVTFGAVHSEWEKLKRELDAGDELWWFTAPRRPGLYGALEGYVVLRGCQQVGEIVLAWD